MISIVIVSHNCARYVGETIESVACQSRRDKIVDTILVDSGSTDDTVAQAKRASTAFGVALKIVQTSNSGPSRARNVGIRESHGRWIQFLDGDDWIGSEKLATQLPYLDNASERSAVVYSQWARAERSGSTGTRVHEAEKPLIDNQDPACSLLRSSNFLAVGSQLFSRSWLLRVHGFNEQLWLIEDVDLMLRLALLGGTFAHAESTKPIFFYRQRSGSLSRRSEREFVEACMRNARMVEAAWGEDLSEERRRVLVEVYRNCAIHFALTDRRRFRQLAARIEDLVPGYLPTEPPRVRRVAALIGYKHAETAGAVWRLLLGLWCQRLGSPRE